MPYSDVVVSGISKVHRLTFWWYRYSNGFSMMFDCCANSWDEVLVARDQ